MNSIKIKKNIVCLYHSWPKVKKGTMTIFTRKGLFYLILCLISLKSNQNPGIENGFMGEIRARVAFPHPAEGERELKKRDSSDWSQAHCPHNAMHATELVLMVELLVLVLLPVLDAGHTCNTVLVLLHVVEVVLLLMLGVVLLLTHKRQFISSVAIELCFTAEPSLLVSSDWFRACFVKVASNPEFLQWNALFVMQCGADSPEQRMNDTRRRREEGEDVEEKEEDATDWANNCICIQTNPDTAAASQQSTLKTCRCHKKLKKIFF